MNDVIWKRCIDIGEYIAEVEATVREAARAFGVSKTTVHRDVATRLPKVRPQLANRVRTVLNRNKEEAYLRGGLAKKLMACDKRAAMRKGGYIA